MRTSFAKVSQSNNNHESKFQRNRSVLMEISSIENDATECLKLLSDEIDDHIHHKNTMFMKQAQGVSPWANQNKEENSPEKQVIFKKSKTSSILPFSLKRPRKGFTENIKNNRRYKNNTTNQKCKTTITRYPSEQNSFSKILILDNKQNEPVFVKNELVKSRVKEDKNFLKLKCKSQQNKEKQVVKQNELKNMVQMTSQCARLKQKILDNLEKEAILSKCQQKALPLPNSIKPLSRLMRRKKQSKQNSYLNGQRSKEHVKPIFVKYEGHSTQVNSFLVESSSSYLLSKGKITKNSMINNRKINY